MTKPIENRLLRWVSGFLFIYALILTLSPAGRERSWAVDLRFSHWPAFFAWLLLFVAAHLTTTRLIQDHDPYLLPTAGLLSGWGLLTIWRLDPEFGLRQTLWLFLALGFMLTALKYNAPLTALRRYKYALLLGGLILTSLTLLLGTNPLGSGPRLWLGCCGVFIQPSEPLKLLLVIYLAAYFADRYPLRLTAIHLLAPTIILTSIALLLLLVQRDLGTATVFICIYAALLYLASDDWRVLLGAAAILSISLVFGYHLIDIIQTRIDSWINPWSDPSGRSYQVIQSLLAVANGGMIGRGPGLGNPSLVPVAISDFIFSAIAEETGLAGILGLMSALWIFLGRGILAALRATDRFRRFLAAGIVLHLGIQSLLIIGGNLRLLPLTGVTLPFISYGGSSLATSFISLTILLAISTTSEQEPVALPDPKPYTTITALIVLGLIVSATGTLWWTLVRGPALLERTDNARRSIADRYVPRGAILDRYNQPINITKGESGAFTRVYLYPNLAPIVGYTHPVYGQAGLEAGFDGYLRGLDGNPASRIWWDHLLYGTPPPGLDLRLSIDLGLQSIADQAFDGQAGALILLNSGTGEILVMTSQPSFDSNILDEIGATLSEDSASPLLNRATQGAYPIPRVFAPLLHAEKGESTSTIQQEWRFYEELGLFRVYDIGLPVTTSARTGGIATQLINPLQLIIPVAAISNHGAMTIPRIAMAVNTPEQGWVILAPKGAPMAGIEPSVADQLATSLLVEGEPYWRHIDRLTMNGKKYTWLTGGTLPTWGGPPLALVIILEEDDSQLLESIQEKLFHHAMK